MQRSKKSIWKASLTYRVRPMSDFRTAGRHALDYHGTCALAEIGTTIKTNDSNAKRAERCLIQGVAPAPSRREARVGLVSNFGICVVRIKDSTSTKLPQLPVSREWLPNDSLHEHPGYCPCNAVIPPGGGSAFFSQLAIRCAESRRALGGTPPTGAATINSAEKELAQPFS
jgi:hypothetical protein